jgi:hypothetical protein
MRNLPSFTNACIALAMYNTTFDLAVPVCSFTCSVVLVHLLQTSFASSVPQRTCSLGLNEYLACRGLIPGGLCCKEMMVVDLVPSGLVFARAKP